MNGTALFECGLALSKGNNYFNVPVRRQSVLNIQMDLEKANTLLYKAMDVDMQTTNRYIGLSIIDGKEAYQ